MPTTKDSCDSAIVPRTGSEDTVRTVATHPDKTANVQRKVKEEIDEDVEMGDGAQEEDMLPSVKEEDTVHHELRLTRRALQRRLELAMHQHIGIAANG